MKPKRTGVDLFMKGPIPVPWWLALLGSRRNGQISTRTVCLALALWFHVNREARTEVVLSQAKVEKFGLTPSARRRALVDLEELGLVLVTRKPGQSPRVTIIVKVKKPKTSTRAGTSCTQPTRLCAKPKET